jgi:hypothetical protein
MQTLLAVNYNNRHEAGHFLVGYLCGMPVESYQADSVTNAVAFYPKAVGTLRGIAEPELLRLAVVSLGGIVAECLLTGNSEGGYADLTQLNALLKRSDTKLSDRLVTRKRCYCYHHATVGVAASCCVQ